MLCMYGVKKHLQGGTLPYSAKDKDLIVVWEQPSETHKGGYKAVPLDTMVEIRANGNIYIVTEGA